MNITTELDKVRTAVPGCLTVAYADLSSGLVLSVSAARRQRQETLDELCATASALLDGAAAERAADDLLGAVTGIDEALRLTPGETLAVLRSEADPVEAICCVGTGEMDVARLVRHARAALSRIGAAG